MANLTFSNKGVPMGRNKSTPVNSNAQWSLEEDKFLRMAAAQNMSAGLIASKLGRTSASVYQRKWLLDIQNDKTMPRIKAPKAAKVKAAPVHREAKAGVQLFQLESGIPVPERGNRGDMQAKMQIRSAFDRIQVGQSFVINKEVLHSTVYIAKNEFGAYRIKTSATSPDKKFFRIFRLA